MRKTVLLMGLLAMMLSATAQNVSVKTQGESPVLGLKKTVMGYTHFYGMDDKSLYVRYATGKPMKVDKVCLGRFNKLMDMDILFLDKGSNHRHCNSRTFIYFSSN